MSSGGFVASPEVMTTGAATTTPAHRRSMMKATRRRRAMTRAIRGLEAGSLYAFP